MAKSIPKAPRLIGCDPVVFSETERAIPGSTRFGAYFEGDLFLFVSSATREYASRLSASQPGIVHRFR